MKSCKNIMTKSAKSVHLKGIDDLNSKGSIDPTTMVPLHKIDIMVFFFRLFFSILVSVSS